MSLVLYGRIMATEIGTKLKKRYEIKEVLGQGEHGKTWKAWDSGSAPQKFCVIKEPVGSHRAIKELEAESAAAGLLHHKNIVPVLEFNESEGFLVEEFVLGRSLQGRLREDARKSTWPVPEEARDIITQCLEGLEYAHEKGRIHGDLKPANIMLPDAGEARLTDFGVSRFVVGQVVSGGAPWDPSRFGSATYSAPEVLLNRSWSVQSDLFSVGILAYLLFTRRHPFVDDSGLWTTKERILDSTVNPPAVKHLSPNVDIRVEQVISKLLERDLTKRYRTAREALDDLLGGRPLSNPCPQCGSDNPPAAKYCNACGKPIAGIELPGTEPEGQLSLSYSLYRAGDVEEAISLSERLLDSHPDFGKGWAHLAFMLNGVRKYEDALKASIRGIACSPGFPSGYRNKGFALSSLGRFEEAVEEFDLALERERNPRDRSQILYNKAYALMLNGKLDEAMNAADQALDEDPTNYKVRSLVSRLQRPRDW